jgi:hypothetical protein
MVNPPIYEKEPLPDTPGTKTGLPHSSYEQARIRSIETEKATTVSPEVFSYKPKTPRSFGTEAQAQEVGQKLVPAIQGHVRRQILNAKQPGLGAMQGPLREDVQKAVERKAAPLVQQVVSATKEKIRKGTSVSPAAPSSPTIPKKDPEYTPPVPKTIFETKVVSGVGLVSKEVPNPNYVPPVAKRSTRDIKYAAEQKVARNAITSKFHELASSAPEAHPDDIRTSTEAWARRNISRTAPKEHDEHITKLTSALKEQPDRHPAMRERAAMVDRAGVTKVEQESGEDVVEEVPTKPARRTTDRDIVAVARDLARSHYQQNFAGKLKNALTGDRHPEWRQSAASKSPSTYLKKQLGFKTAAELDAHITANHADEVLAKGRERASGSALPELGRGSGKKSVPPQAPRAEFPAEYLKNPIAASTAGAAPAQTEPVISLARANELRRQKLADTQEAQRAARRSKRNTAFGEGQAK